MVETVCRTVFADKSGSALPECRGSGEGTGAPGWPTGRRPAGTVDSFVAPAFCVVAFDG
jgi:hypothetical protein